MVLAASTLVPVVLVLAASILARVVLVPVVLVRVAPVTQAQAVPVLVLVETLRAVVAEEAVTSTAVNQPPVVLARCPPVPVARAAQALAAASDLEVPVVQVAVCLAGLALVACRRGALHVLLHRGPESRPDPVVLSVPEGPAALVASARCRLASFLLAPEALAAEVAVADRGVPVAWAVQAVSARSALVA